MVQFFINLRDYLIWLPIRDRFLDIFKGINRPITLLIIVIYLNKDLKGLTNIIAKKIQEMDSFTNNEGKNTFSFKSSHPQITKSDTKEKHEQDGQEVQEEIIEEVKKEKTHNVEEEKKMAITIRERENIELKAMELLKNIIQEFNQLYFTDTMKVETRYGKMIFDGVIFTKFKLGYKFIEIKSLNNLLNIHGSKTILESSIRHFVSRIRYLKQDLEGYLILVISKSIYDQLEAKYIEKLNGLFPDITLQFVTTNNKFTDFQLENEVSFRESLKDVIKIQIGDELSFKNGRLGKVLAIYSNGTIKVDYGSGIHQIINESTLF